MYTALFGGYEDLLEQPLAATSAVDFICFTDDPALVSDLWEIRLVEPAIATDPARSSRFPKLCAHRFLADYDISIYIDNSVLLTRPPEAIITDLLPPGAEFSAFEHSSRETVLDEFSEVARVGYEAGWVCDEQLAHYHQTHPEVLSMKPLIGGVLIRRHMHPDVIAAMEKWWIHVLRFSRRDQLSLRMALTETGLSPVTWQLDIRDSGYWVWPASTGRDRSRGGALPVQAPSLDSEAQTAQDRRIQELEAEMLRRNEDFTEAKAEIDSLATERDDLRMKVTELRTANAVQGRRLDAMRSSASWRYTAWLRSLRRWVP